MRAQILTRRQSAGDPAQQCNTKVSNFTAEEGELGKAGQLVRMDEANDRGQEQAQQIEIVSDEALARDA